MNKQITITISEEQELYLRKFANLQYEGSAHNAGTATPIHVVEDLYDETVYLPKAFFFIRDEAREYIKKQSHNLYKPRVFTYAPGYANDSEFAPFWHLLIQIGTQLNQEEQNESICS